MSTKSTQIGLFAFVLLAVTFGAMDAQAHRILRSRAVPTLNDPVAGAVIPQNDPATGCAANPTYGYGYMITFEWSASPLVFDRTFTLVLQHTGSTAPALEQPGLTDTSYDLIDCNSFVIDANLSNWYWQVLVVNAKGEVRAASEQRPLSFAPCRLPSGQACNAP